MSIIRRTCSGDFELCFKATVEYDIPPVQDEGLPKNNDLYCHAHAWLAYYAIPGNVAGKHQQRNSGRARECGQAVPCKWLDNT